MHSKPVFSASKPKAALILGGAGHLEVKIGGWWAKKPGRTFPILMAIDGYDGMIVDELWMNCGWIMDG